eukprot:CAMPEP_0183325632 /NCGR_PEP_ID=MMETSP0160_2-20130417/80053_1 /TAXON_ID=2839 ORGANISM="Odontella Sinensis, Strain Grunow 1884" /NCGR_SAMPLE_ID=MMETSP0160_2 /ASSEMBLY_ACC=CAM_ASM_000250 /LENGTH=34 /DNA_ID= /DNA_START= /DNA_END= /DNA_ORIENTATION=
MKSPSSDSMRSNSAENIRKTWDGPRKRAVTEGNT